jgi:hypothetical protein
MSRRTIARTTARLAAIAAAVAAVAVPATAASAATCSLQIGTTSRAGNYITGYGSLSQGCAASATADIYIQRHVTAGLWETKGTGAVVHGPGYDQPVNFYCVGQGTQTYHTRISGTTIGGQYQQKDSNAIRVTC